MINYENFIDQLEEEELIEFNDLAQSYKNNYIDYVCKAKKEETQIKNLEEVKAALKLKCKNIFEYKKIINPRNLENENLSDKEKIEIYFNNTKNSDKIVAENLYFKLIKEIKEIDYHYAWNHPMIISKKNKNFIMAINTAKEHFTIAIEKEVLHHFKEEIEYNDYKLLQKGFKIKYNQPINYELIQKIIYFTIELKKDHKNFWM